MFPKVFSNTPQFLIDQVLWNVYYFFRLVNKKQQNILKYDVILEKRKERQARVSL